jgi:hypothetical protein
MENSILFDKEKMKEAMDATNFIRSFTKIFMILLTFIIFSIVQIILKNNLDEYVSILVFSTLTLIDIIVLGLILEKSIKTESLYSSILNKTVSNLLYFVSSPVCLYLFFYKGLYGIFFLFRDFSFWNLIYVIFSILLSYGLMNHIMLFDKSFRSQMKLKT